VSCRPCNSPRTNEGATPGNERSVSANRATSNRSATTETRRVGWLFKASAASFLRACCRQAPQTPRALNNGLKKGPCGVLEPPALGSIHSATRSGDRLAALAKFKSTEFALRSKSWDVLQNVRARPEVGVPFVHRNRSNLSGLRSFASASLLLALQAPFAKDRDRLFAGDFTPERLLMNLFILCVRNVALIFRLPIMLAVARAYSAGVRVSFGR
jgi:hypothetical protein